jgi:hypothetical protein
MDSEGAGAASERTPARRPAPAQRPIVDVIRDRWSARAIDAERAVAPSQVATLLEARALGTVKRECPAVALPGVR